MGDELSPLYSYLSSIVDRAEHFSKQGDWSSAAELWEQAIHIAPHDSYYKNMYVQAEASALRMQANYEESRGAANRAYDLLTAALDLDPRNLEIRRARQELGILIASNGKSSRIIREGKYLGTSMLGSIPIWFLLHKTAGYFLGVLEFISCGLGLYFLTIAYRLINSKSKMGYLSSSSREK